LDAHELSKEVGNSATSKLAKSAMGVASKYLKKLLMRVIKQAVLSIGKMLLLLFGWEGILVILVVAILFIVFGALAEGDWFAKGDTRTQDEAQFDQEYKNSFIKAAKDTVADLYAVPAHKSWINQLVNTVRPSFGLPAALFEYKVLRAKEKLKFEDYDPDELIEKFKPTLAYQEINTDIEWRKEVKLCTKPDGKISRTVTESESKRDAHNVLNKITFDYADMTIDSLKKYYPGGTLKRGKTWEKVSEETVGNCTITTSRQYEDTQVDDRFVPLLNIDTAKFKQVVTELGVDATDYKLYLNLVNSADKKFRMELYARSEEPTGINIDWAPGTADVSELVSRYEPIVRKYLEQKGLGQYTQIVLAMIQQETGGRYLDVMQSSESLGMKPNTLTDPELSIQAGVNHFAAVLQSAGGNVELALQAYNFGGGYINYANTHGGHSELVAKEFSEMMKAKMGWKRYGDPLYVQHVMRYYNEADTSIPSSNGQIFNVVQVMNVIQPYMGYPYRWGGRSPATSFDCSGLLEWSFGQIGINISGTAATQYKKTVAVPADQAIPGDLVFWNTTSARYVSHVGMYLGNDKFINASSTDGVSIQKVSNWNRWYKGLGFRRIVK